MLYLQVGPKKLSDFEYCTVLSSSALFHELVCSFFGDKTCLSKNFWDELLISRDIFILTCCITTEVTKKSSQILNILQFSPDQLNFEGLFGQFFGNKAYVMTLFGGFVGNLLIS